MFRSTGFRLFTVGLLTLLMFIPLFFAGTIIDDRANHARSSVTSISREWGGEQHLSGPYLVIPVLGPVDRVVNRERVDPQTGETAIHPITITETGLRRSLYILPDQFDVTLDTTADERRRGIFRVPVYSATSAMSFTFQIDDPATSLSEAEVVQWDDTRLVMGLSDNRALRGEAALRIDGQNIPLSPRLDASSQSGIEARIGDPRQATQFSLNLGFNGAGLLNIAPVGRATAITMSSDWPHPSFTGAFLPDGSTITDQGFSATWTIPHLARSLPQVSRQDPDIESRTLGFGVRFYQPNDFYQKAYRAARHSILFIALTFLTVFLIENRTERPVHPVQYILIGLAQAIFVVMMTAYAEQIGFDAAFALSAGATIALLTAFGATGLGLGRRTWVLTAALVVIYSVLYLILQSTDYALLTGSTLAFCALAGTIYATRNEAWYGPDRGKRNWLGGLKQALTPPPVPPAPTAKPE